MLELEVGVQFNLFFFTTIKPNKLAILDRGSVVEGQVDVEEEEISSVLVVEA
jgi:hypothetical protein